MIKHHRPAVRVLTSPRSIVLGSTLVGALLAAGCGGTVPGRTSTIAPGTIVDNPAGGGFFIAENCENGNAPELEIHGFAFGRLTDVFGLDSLGLRVPMASDFVIDPHLISDGQTYLIESNPVTGQQLLVIFRDVTDTTPGGGREDFFTLLKGVGLNLSPIFTNDANSAGNFTMIPRNAALVMVFNDLIDPDTILETTFRVRVGNPPVAPFEGRVFADSNWGNLIDSGSGAGSTFFSTRVVVDTTVTELESFLYDPPLPVNGVGLPSGVDVNLANVEVRIPTLLSPGFNQTDLLRNPSGHPLTTSSNGPVDWSSATQDVVRAARSGGTEEVTGDDFNGFLRDLSPPRVVGSQLVELDSPPQFLEEGRFALPSVTFESEFCSQTPSVGDVFIQNGVYAEVIQVPTTVKNGQLSNVIVRLILYPSIWDDPGALGELEWSAAGQGTAEFLAAFNPLDDAGRQGCFMGILPTPTGYPTDPTGGVATASSFTLRFSEPMDPDSLTAFDAMTLTRLPVPDDEDPPLSTDQYVVGALTQSLNLQEFTYVPDLPLAHTATVQESYYMTLSDGKFSPTDLAGNTLEEALPAIELRIDPGAASQRNGGRVTRFTSQDEEEPIGGSEIGAIPEWSGQHIYDLQRELIKPRPVVRSWGNADREQPTVKLMTAFPLGVQTPLSSLGSKMQMMWRYVDFGFGLADPTHHNMDVEGLWWSPAGGGVLVDTYEEFEIQIAHSTFAPDEYIDPDSLFPSFPLSGFKPKFSQNYLDLQNDPPRVMHERFRGYLVAPGDLQLHESTGTKLMPYPWNRNVTPEEWKTYTWRDTDLRKRAGKKCGGVDPKQLWKALGLADPGCWYYREGNVRTNGLALLVEFRCYPDEGAVGANPFDISLAANSSSKPYFRAFSTGGINDSGQPVIRDPDTEDSANGGFNPNDNGKPTFGLDNSFYIGAADFVVRVSRSHSVWFGASNPTGGSVFNKPNYFEPVLEPNAQAQPDGTSIVLAFRGATKSNPIDDTCGNLGVEPWLENAIWLDTYGDFYDDCVLACPPVPNHNPLYENAGIKFKSNNDDWSENISDINLSKYYQVRVTFESNIFTGLRPELSAVAVAWEPNV